MAGPPERAGAGVLDLLAQAGAMGLTFWRIVKVLLPPRFDRNQMILNLYRIGVLSVPIVAVTAAFAGAIMVVQTMAYVRATGADGLVPITAVVAVFSELGPVLIGLMFSGRVGANTTADLGTMVITEQMDALRALAIDPVRYFVAPRFVATVLMLVLLTALGDAFALIGSAATAELLLDIDRIEFWRILFEGELTDEFVVGLVKGGTFGGIISVVSCAYGLGVGPGAREVGRAVNRSVVATALLIFMSDYLITWAWYRFFGGWQ
ncbi:MAG: ABC transporter permease [Deltaproteobacteria bacterium]|nr:ABC transporter permease [Deltaproteobacteria bacterium]